MPWAKGCPGKQHGSAARPPRPQRNGRDFQGPRPCPRGAAKNGFQRLASRLPAGIYPRPQAQRMRCASPLPSLSLRRRCVSLL
eukprot:9498094-Pyramimonas_sp.AAC.1